MRILVTGSHGLIGSALSGHLESGGHEVIPLSRTKGNTPYWNPVEGEIDLEGVGKLDAVVHMAAENIANGRWNKKKKQRIFESRIEGTALLCEALAGLAELPKVLIASSAVGYYGNRGDELLTEESAPGKGFLAEVCQQWEMATESADEVGIRVVNVRTGLVLSRDGGALKKMLRFFKLGLGGVIGSGKQQMSWIDIRDEVGAIVHCIEHEKLSGPINLTAPTPISNREFTKTVGKVLRRPTIFPLPAFLCKLLFGEMGEALLLKGAKVQPKKLVESGYTFQYPNLEESLASLI